MLGPALGWLTSARQCFADPFGGLTRGLLTSTFSLVVGLERVFHLDGMNDPGFARLTGGRRCPSRFSVGGWRRHLPWYEVDAFCRRTSPWPLLRGDVVTVSYDEHTIPRWTHKFHTKKGYVTTRNKYMRCEKLFYSYDVDHDRYLAVRATPGDWGLMDLAVALTRQTLVRGRPDFLHALFDAGAGQADAGVRALWDLVEREQPRLDVTLRACRSPHRVRLWKELPAAQFETYQEPGPFVGARPKEIRVAETTRCSATRLPSRRCGRCFAGRSCPDPRRTAGIRCSRPARRTLTRSWAFSGRGSTTSRGIGWASTMSSWTRCRVAMTRKVPTRSGRVSGVARCRCWVGWWPWCTTRWVRSRRRWPGSLPAATYGPCGGCSSTGPAGCTRRRKPCWCNGSLSEVRKRWFR